MNIIIRCIYIYIYILYKSKKSGKTNSHKRLRQNIYCFLSHPFMAICFSTLLTFFIYMLIILLSAVSTSCFVNNVDS